MPEGQEPTAPEGQEPSGNPPSPPQEPPKGQEPKGETFDAEYVKSLRDEAAKYRAKAAEHAARLKQYEDAQLSEQERLTKQAQEANQRAEQLAAALRQERARVAIAHAAAEAGVPAELVERLVDVEFEEDGRIKTDLKKAVAGLLEKYPNLRPAPVTAGGATNPARSGAAEPKKTAADWLYGGNVNIFDADVARASGGGVFFDPEKNPKQRE